MTDSYKEFNLNNLHSNSENKSKHKKEAEVLHDGCFKENIYKKWQSYSARQKHNFLNDLNFNKCNIIERILLKLNNKLTDSLVLFYKLCYLLKIKEF